VAVTGTNGKTTTTRLLAAIASASGMRPGWSSTDGVYVSGSAVALGDWSGPGGAREVLSRADVDFAILETARGGLMQRGMSVSAIDVAVFTNVSPDHLGLAGLDTIEDLAWAKAAVCRVVRPSGWVVLNAEDRLVRQYHDHGPGRPWFFALDPAGEGAGYAAALGAPLTTVRAGRIVVEGPDRRVDVIAVSEVPVALAGLSQENIANALAATSAGLAMGLPLAGVRQGLAQFVPDAISGAGRMNIWTVPVTGGGAVTVILDFAHNEAGAVALLRVARGLRKPGARVHASIGNAGDRTDAVYQQLEVLGKTAMHD
jgi:cyanophycin synthetase